MLCFMTALFSFGDRGGKLAKTMPATGLMVPGGLNPKGRPFNEKYLGAQIVNPQVCRYHKGSKF